MQVADLTILITGGASGLGAACAEHFAERKANVVLADVNGDAAASLAAKLGSQARAAKTDVTDEASVRAAVQTALDAFGGLHVAINCAGILGGARLVGKQGPHDLGAFRKVIEVNLVGTFNVCRLAAEAIMKNEPNADGERGVLINTSSVATWDGQIGQAAYSASKGGVASMCLPLARELGKFGIRVVAIAPGVFETPMVTGLSEATHAAFVSSAAFPLREGRPPEYALLAQQIVENPMLNGSTIRLDGAMRMPAK